ncbi:MAG: DmsE family decaheme c-type cytochrome [Candidatus Riflebacteria bacterium]|nr:DmsE family decaheme c-type cytochrome [Candidatus Riflebacteria bacterium]
MRPLSAGLVGLLCLLPGVLWAAETAAPQTNGYVGASTCKSCHKKPYESYSVSRHAVKADKRTPAGQHECESCHGPGAQHAEKPSKALIIPLGRKTMTPARVQSAQCQQCHTKGLVRLWQGSAHERHGLSCSSCHQVHAGNKKNLARATATEVCTTCHKDIKAQLNSMSHHPIREGKMSCASCHNPHGTIAPKLIAANNANEKCYECHSEKRGPVLWDHPPVSENCMNCHKPHGSNHDKLLVRRSPFLCQSCHEHSRHPGTLYALGTGQVSKTVYNAGTVGGGNVNNRLFYRACHNCHSQVHGSNHPSGKALVR